MLKGKIKAYHEDHGFGFIEIDGENKDIFFHIKDFPHQNIVPKIGEILEFDRIQENGKFKASRIKRPDIKIEEIKHTPQSRASQQRPITTRTAKNKRPAKKSNWLSSVVILVIIALGIGIYQKVNKSEEPEPIFAQTNVSQPQTAVQQNFSCDGRQHCSQMNSYEEAQYFLKNCPNTKMDGDGDGIPCESQFGH